uniref:G-protein coupled receptors family 1 profile domain-containing protein n=1 Tax=Romanomermis culicivorax TaxID=13658 RepID=A0A915K6Z2_ROMCU
MTTENSTIIADFQTWPAQNVYFENLSANCVDARRYLADIHDDKIARLEFQLIFLLVYSVIFFCGVLGNCLVVASVCREQSLHTVRNIFIVSLSLSDTLVCFTSVPITPFTSVYKVWLFGSAMCKLFPLFQCASIFVSTFTLAAIALDRYILIVHPTKPPITLGQAIKIIVGIWMAAVATGVPIASESRVAKESTYVPIGYPIVTDESGPSQLIQFCGEFCGERWDSNTRRAYGTAVLLLQFVLPFVVITFSYARLLSAVAASRRKSRRRNRTTKMLISMVVLFTVCWLPQVTVNVLNDFNLIPDYIIDQHVYGLTFHAIAMTSTCWNPMLYAGMNENFRVAFLLLLPPVCRRLCRLDDSQLIEIRRRNFDSATTIAGKHSGDGRVCYNSRTSNNKFSPTPVHTTQRQAERQRLLNSSSSSTTTATSPYVSHEYSTGGVVIARINPTQNDHKQLSTQDNFLSKVTASIEFSMIRNAHP